MKKVIIVLLSVLLVMMLFGCGDTGAGDAGFNITTRVISARTLNTDQIIDPNSLWFLGGQINFFSIDSLETLKNSEWGTQSIYTSMQGTQTSDLGNVIPGGFYFSNQKDYSIGVQSVPEFESEKYNLITIDIGGGDYWFDIQGLEPTIVTGFLYPDREAVFNQLENLEAEIDANKIVLMDNNFIQQGFYVSSDAWSEISFIDSLENLENDFGLTDEQLQITKDMAERVNYALSDGYDESDFDLDGALILPFQAADFSSYDTNNTITLDFQWSLSGSVGYDSSENKYFLIDRFCGLPFDFDIKLIME